MWIFSVLPDSVYHALLIVGIVAFALSYLLKMVPFFVQNAFMIRIASMTLIIFCVWIEGGIAVENKWKARVAELELKVAKAEREAADANTELEATIAAKNRDIAAAQTAANDAIRKYADKINKTCVVDDSAITILNNAARGVKK